MKIAIVAATKKELEGLEQITHIHHHTLTFHIHGVGAVASTFHLTEIIQQKPDLIIQIGLAGTFNNDIKQGQTVVVHTELLGDTGAEDQQGMLDLIDLGLLTENEFPFSKGGLQNPYTSFFPTDLKQVKGLTVNLSAGCEATIQIRKLKFNADIESMEGAAFHYVCLQKQIPFIQFRTISNVVEPRNKDNWNIPLALTNSHASLIHYLENLN